QTRPYKHIVDDVVPIQAQAILDQHAVIRRPAVLRVSAQLSVVLREPGRACERCLAEQGAVGGNNKNRIALNLLAIKNAMRVGADAYFMASAPKLRRHGIVREELNPAGARCGGLKKTSGASAGSDHKGQVATGKRIGGKLAVGDAGLKQRVVGPREYIAQAEQEIVAPLVGCALDRRE